MTDNIEFTHQQARAFQPQRLSAPRDFMIPKIISDNKDEKPLILEIGAGKGKHALSFALQNPDKHLIAIERTRNKFDAFSRLATLQDLPNLDAIHADAIAWTVHALKPNSVAKIFILYPNPEQHNPNQQWLNMPFFEFLLSRLQVGGEIILATNIQSYMDNAEHQAAKLWCLPNTRYRVPVDSQRTHFEVKYLARQEVCWELSIRKPKWYKTRFDNWQA
ncbi:MULTISPECIES: SAM-dependent methyltransferase [Psychrobacter]|uniref:tRNA (guanine(46)-N(7))-methyltransferase n=1 Tax=Psychrobacter pocilloporae TaxID=1775882 RepID=A0ABT6ISQ3_9GAMM|nr:MULTISPECIES: SAM-dependent methyltransferase [Psychrobacter]AOY42835.1 tRNA (guanine-N(7)-)-methyltransferase [Psychrobacter sp. AntiMn-1]MDE0844525.1 SAM-dependent methyltransferase [Psychrobacter pacificensis]MDH4904859.1 SAM-dependent methyltransferase [Psychrobacter pocilloporae]MED6318103.1 SAM-dependent methyltransferase [Pseudomonadota bacterium]